MYYNEFGLHTSNWALIANYAAKNKGVDLTLRMHILILALCPYTHKACFLMTRLIDGNHHINLYVTELKNNTHIRNLHHG